jgi:putative sigma-54 modulation protein
VKFREFGTPSGTVLERLNTAALVSESLTRESIARPIPEEAPDMMTTEKLLKNSSTVLFFDMGAESHVTPKNTTHMTSAPIVVSGVHMDLTDALKETVCAKVERLLRHNPRIIRVLVELVYTRCSDHSREFGAQIRLELPGPDIVVREESDDLYKSIDILVDKVDRQLRRRHRLDKEKRNHPHPTDLGDLGRAA